MQLECKSCGYRMEKPKVPNVCPYCNKKETVDLVETAQDFLND